MIKPKKYRAKLLHHPAYVEGVYYCYPETTYCFEEDYKTHPVEDIHVIINHSMTDWGLPNELKVFRIDPETLEEVE